MTRAYSPDRTPHRDLIRLSNNVQRGGDVQALEVAGRQRLDARDIDPAPIGRDGILTASEFDRLTVAGRYLGALESTLSKTDAQGRRILTIGVQRMIRDPASRTPAQLARARQRIQALERERAARKVPPPGRLTAAERVEARRRFERAMRLGYQHRDEVHYTQGARRWDGIRLELRSADGRYPTYADCSSFTTWALWNALTGATGDMDFPDVVIGADWTAGYTGTQTLHGEVVDLDKLQIADLVFYGGPWPYGHVAGYVGDGLVISHGSESGPHLLPVRYRSDVSHARRYIL